MEADGLLDAFEDSLQVRFEADFGGGHRSMTYSKLLLPVGRSIKNPGVKQITMYVETVGSISHNLESK